MAILPLSSRPMAALSAYYRDIDNKLHNISSEIAIDPEGVTEEDVERMCDEVVNHLEETHALYKRPVLVLIQGGDA